MSCRLVCTSSRLYLLRLACVLVNPISTSIIIPNRIIHTIEIAILRCRHLDFAMPNIPLPKPHHTRLILPCSQVQHARRAVVVFPVETEASAFAREQLAKGRMGIAIQTFAREESAIVMLRDPLPMHWHLFYALQFNVVSFSVDADSVFTTCWINARNIPTYHCIRTKLNEFCF